MLVVPLQVSPKRERLIYFLQEITNMKKLGLIIALALVVTIGGVYATFNYAQGTATQDSQEIGHTISGMVGTTEKGTITITSTFMINVDDTTNSLKTGYTTSGETKVKFTAATGADADVRDNGIKLKLTINITGTNAYNGTAIYVLKSAYTDGGVLLNDGAKVNGEITVNLADYIEVSEISLPTAAEYTAYKTAFDATKIEFVVSEAE